MAEKKITKREHFEGIAKFLADNGQTEWAKIMEHEIELLAKKSSKSATPTPSQRDNAEIADIVKDILAEQNEGISMSTILRDSRIVDFKCHDGAPVSSQKLTSVLTALVKAKDITREVVKKTPFFKINYGEVEG